MNDSVTSTDAPEERRLHERHLTRLRVQLIRNDTLPQVVKTVELSAGGMHVETDKATAQLLAPPDGPPPEEQPRAFTARLTPPHGERPAGTMTMQVEVGNIVKLDDDRYRVGLRFTSFFGQSRRLLTQFIDSLSGD